MKKNVVKKIATLGVSLGFILVAFIPAVYSQVGTGDSLLCGKGGISDRGEIKTQDVEGRSPNEVNNVEGKTMIKNLCIKPKGRDKDGIVWKTRSTK